MPSWQPLAMTKDQRARATVRIASVWQVFERILLHEPRRLLTVREVAEVLSVSTAVIYRLCERNELPHLRVSNAIRIAAESVAKCLATKATS